MEMTRPSGTKLIFNYERSDLSDISALNRQNTPIQTLKFHYPPKKEYKHNPSLTVEGAVGQKVTYQFHTFRYRPKHSYFDSAENDDDDDDDPRLFLTGVVRPNGPSEIYTYERKSISKKHFERVIRKDRPEGRYLNVQYYKVGENSINGLKVTLGEHHPMVNRVRCD